MSEMENNRCWYIVQTSSGLEYAAKRNLEQRIISMNMQDYIFQVLIPETRHMEKTKKGVLKEVVEKEYPGYLFVDMIVTDDSWFIVRNTPMVTGFLGSSGGGAKPVPLTEEEVFPILKKCGLLEEIKLDFKVGDTVHIISGTFAGQDAEVESIDISKESVTVLTDFFGRKTPTILGLNEVKALEF